VNVFDRALHLTAILSNAIGLAATLLAGAFALAMGEHAAASTWWGLSAGNVFIFFALIR
jgi:hypothetical protein